MEDQGIMALPQGMPMQAPTARAQTPEMDPAAAAAFDQARQDISPKEFSKELMAGAEQADPAAVQRLKQALKGQNIPQEVIDALQQIIDVFLNDPQNYKQILQSMLADGLPSNFFPPEFDAAFLAAFKVALDQLESEGSSMGQEVQQFANGGIANLRPIAREMSKMGRSGDSMLAHITPREARMLQMAGGVGTINPKTGLREYGFWKSIVNTVKNVVKGVGDAVGSVVNAVKDFAKSSVGKVVTSIALGFFLGPAAASLVGVSSAAGVAAVSGIVGGFGSTMLAGGSIKDALKNGVIGGLTAGITSGVMGGANAFEAGSYTGPTTVGGQWDRFKGGIESLSAAGQPTAGAPTTAPVETTLTGAAPPVEGAAMTPGQVTATQGVVTPGQVTATAPTAGYQITPEGALQAPPSGIGEPLAQTASVRGLPGTTLTDTLQGPLIGNQPVLTSADYQAMAGRGPMPYADVATAADAMYANPNYAPMGPLNYSDVATASDLSFANPNYVAPDGARSALGQAWDTTKGMYTEYVKPWTPSGIEEAARPEALNAAKTAYSEAISSGLSKETANSLAMKAYEGAMPGVFTKYAPMAAAGTLAAYGMGAFKQEPAPTPKYIPSETGVDLLRSQPDVYGTTPGGAQTTYYTPSYSWNPNQMMYRPRIEMRRPQYGSWTGFAQGGIASLAPRRYETGGYAAGGTSQYPRRYGEIAGPGTGTSDEIPAMLSDGEFVMTAKAVRGAGGGSRREGARKMYRMMRMLERKG